MLENIVNSFAVQSQHIIHFLSRHHPTPRGLPRQPNLVQILTQILIPTLKLLTLQITHPRPALFERQRHPQPPRHPLLLHQILRKPPTRAPKIQKLAPTPAQIPR